MSTEMKCPTCGSDKTRKWKGAEISALNAFNFPPVAPRECESCGQVWEPVASRWVVIGGIVFGLVLIGLAFLFMPLEWGGSRALIQFVLALVVGLSAIVTSCLRLRKRGPRLIGTGGKDSK